MNLSLMQFGKYRGQPIHKLPSYYLLFLTSRSNLPFKRPELIRAVLAELRERFADFDTLATEIMVDDKPPEYFAAVEAREAKHHVEMKAYFAQRDKAFESCDLI